MSIRILTLLLCTTFFSLVLHGQKGVEYPIAQKDSSVDIYHGISIKDPYQWMENLEDPRLKVWLEEQEKLLEKHKKKYVNTYSLSAQLYSMYSETIEIANENYESEVYYESEKYQFDYKTFRSDRTPELLFKTSNEKRYRILVRMRDLRPDKGDNAIVENIVINDDEDLVALFVSVNGSDWREVYFFDLLLEELLPHKLSYLRNTSRLAWDGEELTMTDTMLLMSPRLLKLLKVRSCSCTM